MDVIDQLHAPDDYPRRKRPRYPTDTLCGSQSR